MRLLKAGDLVTTRPGCENDQGLEIGRIYIVRYDQVPDRNYVYLDDLSCWETDKLKRVECRPDPGCPLCFGTGTQHCGMATHEANRHCGEPCACPFRREREQWRLTRCLGEVSGCGRGYVYSRIDPPGPRLDGVLATVLYSVDFARRTRRWVSL